MIRVLVIRHGAFGDIVLSFPAFAALRAHHPKAEITVLTTRPYAALLAASPWFDHVEVDDKPNWWNFPGLLRLKRQLAGFDVVYDLQTSGRSTRYFALAGQPAWSGIARGCAFPDAPNRAFLHTRERLEGQLRAAGVSITVPDLSWLTADISAFSLPERYVVFVPGGSAHRLDKRWPATSFAALKLDLPVVTVGTKGEGALAREIGGINLTGRTDFFQLATVLRKAAYALGNDTGPLHLAAAVGTPCVALFSLASDPKRAAPRYPDGSWPSIIHVPDLAALPVAQVRAALP